MDSAAALILTGAGSIASSRQVTNNGVIDISTTNNGASFTTLEGTNSAAVVNLGAQSLTITAGNNTNFAGVIGGSGALNIAGGTQVLSGTNVYAGLTTVNSGATLALAGTGSIAMSAGVVANGAFDISGTSAGASITTLSGLGTVALGSQILNVTAGAAGPDGTNPAGIFAGVISGLGGVAITGGHQELRGQNTYQGGTLVTNGAIVSVNNSASLGASTSTLTLNGGTLVVDAAITIPQPVTLLGAAGTDIISLNSHNVTFSGAINGPGVLTAVNGGTLTLSGTVAGLSGIVLGSGVTLSASPIANVGIGTIPDRTGAEQWLDADRSVYRVCPCRRSALGREWLDAATGDPAGRQPGRRRQRQRLGGDFERRRQSPRRRPRHHLRQRIRHQHGGIDLYGRDRRSGLECRQLLKSCRLRRPVQQYRRERRRQHLYGERQPDADSARHRPAIQQQLHRTGGLVVHRGTCARRRARHTSLTQPAAGAGLVKGTRFDALYYNAGTSVGTSAIDYAQNAAGNPTAVNLWVTPSSYQDLSPWNTSLARNQSQVALALDALRGVNDLNPAASLSAGLKNNAQATWAFGKLFPQQPQNLPGIFNQLSGEVAADAKLASFEMTNQFLDFMLNNSVNGRRGGSGALAMASDEQAATSDTALGYAASATKASAPRAFEQRWSAWGSAFGLGLNAKGDAAVGSSDVTARVYGAGRRHGLSLESRHRDRLCDGRRFDQLGRGAVARHRAQRRVPGRRLRLNPCR